eukprot:CAMPEP_0118714014 /NCGR_PEP_ID=MMETSP0800-20121206/25901_1 /TAXON_ID=210618 ORGANISM="Striatella unipunctata, Strain CCMP2910" /NCGR_SAMPLE_ID=MMETSP0800 /ASSEMBLY_ACC=CAM_ASM_000638 /LENGTH=423 /DNA_ID=CAMNT_0006619659 /DNA_START=1035 /DNA_END=2306 /DNA_ORIENTATION=-
MSALLVEEWVLFERVFLVGQSSVFENTGHFSDSYSSGDGNSDAVHHDGMNGVSSSDVLPKGSVVFGDTGSLSTSMDQTSDQKGKDSESVVNSDGGVSYLFGSLKKDDDVVVFSWQRLSSFVGGVGRLFLGDVSNVNTDYNRLLDDQGRWGEKKVGLKAPYVPHGSRRQLKEKDFLTRSGDHEEQGIIDHHRSVQNPFSNSKRFNNDDNDIQSLDFREGRALVEELLDRAENEIFAGMLGYVLNFLNPFARKNSAIKKNDVRQVIVDHCVVDEEVVPISILEKMDDYVTFSVQQVWSPCSSSSTTVGSSTMATKKDVGWIAADFVGVTGTMQCDHFKTSSTCEESKTYTAQCRNKAAVVDVYTHFSDSFFGQKDGSAVPVPLACGKPEDHTKSCHFRYVLDCSSWDQQQQQQETSKPTPKKTTA